jgi:hypothetical protein
VSEIIFPQTFKIATISPVHGSKSLSLTAWKVTDVFCKLELITNLSDRDRVFISYLTFTIWSAILKHSNKLISVLKINRTFSLKSTVAKPSSIVLSFSMGMFTAV